MSECCVRPKVTLGTRRASGEGLEVCLVTPRSPVLPSHSHAQNKHEYLCALEEGTSTTSFRGGNNNNSGNGSGSASDDDAGNEGVKLIWWFTFVCTGADRVNATQTAVESSRARFSASTRRCSALRSRRIVTSSRGQSSSFGLRILKRGRNRSHRW